MQVQKKLSKKKLIITAAIVLTVIASTITYALMSQNSDQLTNQKTNSDSSKDSSNTSTEEKKESESSSNSTSHEKEKDIQPPYEGEDPNNNPSLTGVITYKSIVGANLSLRTTIDQYLSSGTCRLSLTSGTKAVTRSSAIAPNPSSSTCEGFDVPIAELGGGTWNIEIIVTSGDRTGALKDSVTL